MFDGPKLKIKRANQHIKELNSTLTTFGQSDFYTIVIDRKTEPGTSIVTLEVTTKLPCEVPLILGDAAHNIRAALDLFFCDLYRLADKEPTKYTKFPFFDTPDELVAAIKGGILKAIPDHPIISAILKHIVEAVQPYVGGHGAALAFLHDLDIQDKHFLVVPVIQVTQLTGVDCEDSRGVSYTNTTMTVTGDRKVRAIATNARNLKITNHGKASIHVLFDKGQPFEGQPVVPTLANLSQAVSEIISAVEKIYLTHRGASA